MNVFFTEPDTDGMLVPGRNGACFKKQSNLYGFLLKHSDPVHLLTCVFVQPPTSNESIPEEAQPKVQPNVIPIYCTNKVRIFFQCKPQHKCVCHFL